MTTDAIVFDKVAFAYHGQGLVTSKRAILHEVSFRVAAGEVFVLLGHNGAGKTTLVRILLGLLPDYQGRVELFGRSTDEPTARRVVGYLPEHPVSCDHLDARAFLLHFAALVGLGRVEATERVASLLARSGLDAHGDRLLGEYSKGMLQRLNLCRALLADPALLVLDEPVIGLDPLGQALIREVVTERRAAGRTILINTHATSFACACADRIGFLMGGRLVETWERARFAPQPGPTGGAADPVETRFLALATALEARERAQ